MAVIIEESKMHFGPYSEEQVFQIEKSTPYTKSLRPNGIKCCEFILLRNNKLYFVEAKETCPNQIVADSSKEMKEKYHQTVNDIAEKMRHSLAMYANFLLGQYDSGAIPRFMQENLLADKEIRLLLVVKNAKKEWLLPFKDVLEKELRRDMRIWKIQSFIVINEETACKKHFISKIATDKASEA